MANTRSALKRMRQNEKRRVRNSGVKSRVRVTAKAARVALAEGANDAAGEARRAATVADRAVSRGVLHRNTAARMKSRLARRLNKLLASSK